VNAEILPESGVPEPGPRPKSFAPPVTAIRAQAPKPRRLSRKTLIAGALVLGGLIAFALVNGFSTSRRAPVANADTQQTIQSVTPPEEIRERPATYDASQLQPPIEQGHDFLWGDHSPSGASDSAGASTTQATVSAAYQGASATVSRSPLQIEMDAARTSPILFGAARHTPDTNANSSQNTVGGPHSDFVNAQHGASDGVLDATYVQPHSPFTVQAGSTISAALLTALNSDQPGRVIAQVSENVFDSVTGERLLIPQGARLLGTYDADTKYGEQRLLIVWSRLIMPNGWSIALRGMPGADASGGSGLRGQVDNHIGRIAVASLLSGALGVAANQSENDHNERLTQSVGNAAAQQAAQTGSRIVDRELSVRPTLRIAAGERVRVIINADIVLRPYQE
jgi:type IV secretion system protein VirB10